MSDPYSVLGLTKDATDAEIKVAYRKLAMTHHPDQNPGNAEAEAKFKQISAAYEEIKSPEKRMSHDQQGRGQQGFNFGFNGTNIDDLLRQFHEQASRPRNRNFNTQCVIDFNSAFRGCEVALKMPDGREVRLKIPAGVDNGTRIRVQDGGETVHSDQPAGDLFVGIEVTPHPTFGRNGKQLFIETKISAIDAMLGTTVKVPTIDGEELEIQLPAGIQNGHTVRVAERGMPLVNSTIRGDMTVGVGITIPQNLSEKQIELLNEIKACKI
jgi:DnaJ-class molecular chaperone